MSEITQSLRETCTLVELHVRYWTARRIDRKAAGDVAEVNSANRNAFTVHKKLLAGVDAPLKKVIGAFESARRDYYLYTSPFDHRNGGRVSGPRLLPNGMFFRFVERMNMHKKMAEDALEKEFLPQYPDLIEAARNSLGGTFDGSEYPPVDNIRDMFGMQLDFNPVPTGMDFRGLPEAVLQRLAEKHTANTQKALHVAMQDAWQRAYDTVKRYVERLSDDARFHASMVDDARELVEMLRHLNVTNDQELEEIRQTLETKIVCEDADALRKSPDLRRAVAKEAEDTLSRILSVFNPES